MSRWISTASCAGAILSVVIAAAPSASAQAATSKPQSKTEVVAPSRPAMLSGCVVRDAAHGGQPTISSNGISYRLTGRPPAEFSRYLGKRLEVTGALTVGSTAVPTTGTSETDGSIVPKGLTATAGQSDVTTTGVARDNTVPADHSTELGKAGSTARRAPTQAVPLVTDRGTTADLTGQMKVKTIRMISPNCL